MINERTWYVLGVNPTPWAVGPLSVGRRSGGVYPQMGRNQELHAYKEALRHAMVEEYPYLREYMDDKSRSLWAGAEVELTFHFWHKFDIAEVNGKKIKTKPADLTNMVKATEDAVQGLLLNNDTQVRAQRSVIYQRGEDVPEGIVVVSIQPFYGPDPDELPSFAWEKIDEIFRQSNGDDGAASARLFEF